MKESEKKLIVKEKYGKIAVQADSTGAGNCCCGPASSCCGTDYTVFSESYEALNGYNADADMGLGCGIPTGYAGLKPGNHVLDLGSGAGNDCFVARAEVGESGWVTGLDFTEEMVSRARANLSKLGYENIEFVLGDIEEMPFIEGTYDVVISNCVLNLVPDKARAFDEIWRVLKPGGHFCVSDVVIIGDLPEKLRSDAEMYAGCVSGAIEMDGYLSLIHQAKFHDVQVHKQKRIELPDSLLMQYLSESEVSGFGGDSSGIFSITVSGRK
ncbi:MAG: arsenite methyltransferase [Bacteroidales bacterium]|nr:arsenite methyltransferase [Bacteroidales bacterium]